MKKDRLITYSFLFLILISVAYSLDDCSDVVYIEDVPCLILLQYVGNCNSVILSVYDESTFIYNQTMSNYSLNKCNATLNQSEAGTYSLSYSTGDTGTIVVKEGYLRLYVYIVLYIILAILLFSGYFYQNPHMLFLCGILCTVMAIDIFFNGFPRVSDTFMTNAVSMIMAGIGMYHLVAPYLDWLKENEGSM